MPCSDIAETIILRFDGDDRLRSYSLNKRTCGADVGHAELLAPYLSGQTAEQLLTVAPEQIWQQAGQPTGDEEFLVFKHLVAVQEAACVLLGQRRGDTEAACTAVSILTDERGLRFEGLLAVEAVADRIRACGNCRSCGG